MTRFCIGLALWALLLALAACGGDSKGTDPARDAELAEMVDTVVSIFDDLTVCTDKREGATAYVEDEDSAYVCKKGLWVVDDSLTKAVRPDSEKKSSNGKSSSSGKNNPSSPVASPCKTEAADNCEYGTLTDDRDGQTYKTVKIGEQWWMAENLNYRYIQQTAEEDSSSYCYNDDPANCAKYGRLYLRSAAMIVCPEGWHLPDTTEWSKLFTAVGGDSTTGKKLKSQSGWKDYDGTSGNGTDAYGFSALPAGDRNGYGNFNNEGRTAYFWSSTERNSNVAYGMGLYYNHDSAYPINGNKYDGLSVRCLKDYKSSSSEKNSSSSSVVPTNSSSSSVVPTNSSSSSAVPLGCKIDTEDNCEYGSLTDDRDGQTYKTVKIGEQWWMAENLNYRYIQQTFEGAEEDSSSYCYYNDPANCAKYGRLYLWSAAMDSAGIIPGNSANGCGDGTICNLGNVKVRGVCPEGWHLPDITEWNALFNAVGYVVRIGLMLKSTEGWNDRNDGTSGNGTDAYSFSALPAGFRDGSGDYYGEGYDAGFWSSTENDSSGAYLMGLNYNHNDAMLHDYGKYGGFSVRCLRD
jgi:uncharacterized protein (TIGR02145 family)